MNYELEFDPRALKEWKKLDETVKTQFKQKLAAVLINPDIPANRLREFPYCYKIKLKKLGYRLVYQIQHEKVVVFVVAVGKREKEETYDKAKERLFF